VGRAAKEVHQSTYSDPLVPRSLFYAVARHTRSAREADEASALHEL